MFGILFRASVLNTTCKMEEKIKHLTAEKGQGVFYIELASVVGKTKDEFKDLKKKKSTFSLAKQQRFWAIIFAVVCAFAIIATKNQNDAFKNLIKRTKSEIGCSENDTILIDSSFCFDMWLSKKFDIFDFDLIESEERCKNFTLKYENKLRKLDGEMKWFDFWMVVCLFSVAFCICFFVPNPKRQLSKNATPSEFCTCMVIYKSFKCIC